MAVIFSEPDTPAFLRSRPMTMLAIAYALLVVIRPDSMSFNNS
jgi:hypothetical protein